MGLCKCPKRKVTQQFCFEHKVNVCEFCMTREHRKCVVHPYLQWLEDSSFSRNCTLCQQDLSQDDTIRLLCYHLFHWKCLDAMAKQLPSHTPPAGYQCPDCHKAIFPATTSNSPIAIQLKNAFSNVEWAKVGISLSMVGNGNVSLSESSTDGFNGDVPQVVHYNQSSSDSIPVAVSNVMSHFASSSPDTSGYTLRKVHDSNRRSESHSPLLDSDDKKYQRKGPFEFLTRLFSSRQTLNASSVSSFRRLIIIGILLVLALFLCVYYLVQLGRDNAEHDLSLDPAFNPHIRVGEN
ncbi:Zinc finger protein-like 1 [Halotydeus destructor]|nr:Zinc finger protein-like 1 [Halotydeus destructor]